MWAVMCGCAHRLHIRQPIQMSIQIRRQAAVPADRNQAADPRSARSPSGALPLLLTNCVLQYVHAALGAQSRHCASMRGRRVLACDALSLPAARHAHRLWLAYGRWTRGARSCAVRRCLLIAPMRACGVCATPRQCSLSACGVSVVARSMAHRPPSAQGVCNSRVRAASTCRLRTRLSAPPAPMTTQPRTHRATRLQRGSGAARGLCLLAGQYACVTI